MQWINGYAERQSTEIPAASKALFPGPKLNFFTGLRVITLFHNAYFEGVRGGGTQGASRFIPGCSPHASDDAESSVLCGAASCRGRLRTAAGCRAELRHSPHCGVARCTGNCSC